MIDFVLVLAGLFGAMGFTTAPSSKLREPALFVKGIPVPAICFAAMVVCGFLVVTLD